MAYNPNSYFNYEAGRGSIYKSPPKSKPKNANQQAAKSMGSVGIGGIGGKPTTSSAKRIQDKFREQTQKDSGSTYDEIALPTEAEVDKGIKRGLGAPDKPDDDKDQSPLGRIKSTLDSVSEMMGLGKPEKPKKSAYTPDRIYSTAAFRARSNDPIDFTAQNRRIDDALDFGNRAPMAYLPVGGTYDEIKKQRGADERNQKKMAESINATIEQLYAANDPARQFYQSGVPMEQRLFAPELGYDEIALPSEATVDKKIKGLGARPEVTVTEPVYTVESGDTLSEIAQKNNTTVEEIVRINNIEDKDIINVGQKIKLEDTSVDAPEVSVTELSPAGVTTDDDMGLPSTRSETETIMALEPMFEFISEGEGGYNSSNRGTSGGKIKGSTNSTTRDGKKLTEMTIGEIKAKQDITDPNNAERLFAVGRFQAIPDTLDMAVDALGLSDDTVFNEDTQNKVGKYLVTKKRQRVGTYLEGSSTVSQDTAMLDLAKEFASFPVPYDMTVRRNGKDVKLKKGDSYYGSGNKAQHTVDEVKDELDKLRGNI